MQRISALMIFWKAGMRLPRRSTRKARSSLSLRKGPSSAPVMTTRPTTTTIVSKTFHPLFQNCLTRSAVAPHVDEQLDEEEDVEGDVDRRPSQRRRGSWGDLLLDDVGHKVAEDDRRDEPHRHRVQVDLAHLLAVWQVKAKPARRAVPSASSRGVCAARDQQVELLDVEGVGVLVPAKVVSTFATCCDTFTPSSLSAVTNSRLSMSPLASLSYCRRPLDLHGLGVGPPSRFRTACATADAAMPSVTRLHAVRACAGSASLSLASEENWS